MPCVGTGPHLRLQVLLVGIEVAVGGHAAGRVLVGRRGADACLAPVVGHAEDDLRRRHEGQVLARGAGVVVVVAGQRSRRTEAEAAARHRCACVVGVLEVVGHDEERIDAAGEPSHVEESQRVEGRAGVRVDGQVAAGRHGPAHRHGEVGHPVARPRAVGRAAAAVEALVIDVDAVNAFRLDRIHGSGDGGAAMQEARAHVRCAGTEVLEDYRQHHLHAVRVRRGEQSAQLARVPYRDTRVVDEVAVVLDVNPEVRDCREQREVPRRVAHARVGQAARQREPEHLALGPAARSADRHHLRPCLERRRRADVRGGHLAGGLLHHVGVRGVRRSHRRGGRRGALGPHAQQRDQEHQCRYEVFESL